MFFLNVYAFHKSNKEFWKYKLIQSLGSVFEMNNVFVLFGLNLGNDHLTWRGGGYVFFLKKYSDSQCCWKKYSDFGGGKKNLIQSFCYNVKLWEKNILTLVRKFFSERNKKP